MNRLVVWGFAALLITIFGCTKSEEQAEGNGVDELAGPPDLLTVTDTTPDLMFRYESGQNASGIEYSVAPTIKDVPRKAREAVLVVDLNQSPEERRAGRYAQVFDLRKKQADGTYPGRVISLVNIQRVPQAAARRLLADEKQTVQAEKAEKKRPARVIMYSTKWCGYCKKAKRFMERKKIPYIEKDIETDPQAMKELGTKIAASGKKIRGVPVFDLGGKLVPGFDKNKILAYHTQ
ncbi:MAG: glutaredoxin family protein [Bradymonadia bacterium]